MHRTIAALVVLLLLSGVLPVRAGSPKAEQKPPADQGSGDPADFPRPPGLVRKSYSLASGLHRDDETATYHGSAAGDDLISLYTTNLSAAGWTQQSRSDSGSGKSRVTIIDWEKPAKEAEVRFYHDVAGGGTDLWVRVFTYKTSVTGKSAAILQTEPQAVPDLVGKTQAEATQLLAGTLNLSVNPVPKPTPNLGLDGKIVEQSPAAGQMIAKSSPITVTVWKARTTVPELHLKSVHDARLILSDRKLRVKVGSPVTPLPAGAQEWDEVVDTTSPGPATEVDLQTEVTLIPRLGTVAAPNLVGKDRFQIETMGGLNGGLHVDYSPQPKSTLILSQDGRVAEQSPAAGQMVDRLSTIAVTVWKARTTVPEMHLKSIHDARLILNDRKLRAKVGPPVTPLPAAAQESDEVVDTTSPGTATEVDLQTEVTLIPRLGTVAVPNVVGKDRFQLEMMGLNGGLHLYYSPQPKTTLNPSMDGKVAEQSPLAGQVVDKFSAIAVTFWKARTTVPELHLKSVHDAKLLLNDRKLRAKVGTPVTPLPAGAQEWDEVVDTTSPAPATEVDLQTEVTLIPRLGTVTVPNLVGKDRFQLEMSGPSGGLHLDYSPQPKPTLDQSLDGKVAEQSPAAGQTVDRFSTVTLTMWKVQVRVPDVYDKSLADARQRLRLMNLRSTTGAPVAPLPAGATESDEIVYTTSPARGAMVDPQSEVTLNPKLASVSVPDLVGRTRAEAIQLVSAGHLHLDTSPPPKSTLDLSLDGKIAEQSPAAGQYVDKFGTVEVTTWAVMTTVPDVVGQTVVNAGKLLGEVHLSYETTTGPVAPDARSGGLVSGQSPAAGHQVRAGTKVMLTLYRDRFQ